MNAESSLQNDSDMISYKIDFTRSIPGNKKQIVPLLIEQMEQYVNEFMLKPIPNNELSSLKASYIIRDYLLLNTSYSMSIYLELYRSSAHLHLIDFIPLQKLPMLLSDHNRNDECTITMVSGFRDFLAKYCRKSFGDIFASKLFAPENSMLKNETTIFIQENKWLAEPLNTRAEIGIKKYFELNDSIAKIHEMENERRRNDRNNNYLETNDLNDCIMKKRKSD